MFQLDFSGERTKILESNIDGYKKEIAALRDKNTKYTANISRLEQVVATLRQVSIFKIFVALHNAWKLPSVKIDTCEIIPFIIGCTGRFE